MRTLSALTLLAFLSIAAPSSTCAQSATPRARTAAKPASAPAAPAAACTSAAPAPTPPRSFPPYTAKRQTTQVNTLANGTVITTDTISYISRDAAGRTRIETIRTPQNGPVIDAVNITDPVQHIRFSYSAVPSAAKVVTVFPFAVPSAQPASPVQPPTHRYYPYKNESLPPQTIAGLYAEGNRSTRTIPAGYEGNDRDITTTTESWTSPDLGLNLRNLYDDPRVGKTTTEVTDIQQTAPDPALFKLPEGYEVRNVNPTQP